MSKRISCIVASALTLLACSCLRLNYYPYAKPGTYEVESSECPLVLKRYNKLGIEVAFPSDLLKKEVFNSRWWQDTYDCQTLTFVLARARGAGLEGGDLVFASGHVNVYTPQQYDRWMLAPGAISEGGELIEKGGRWDWRKEDEMFDVLRISAEYGCDYQGFMGKKTYRIDRKASDGRVIQAMITRTHYTQYSKIYNREITAITNILQSVRFIQ